MPSPFIDSSSNFIQQGATPTFTPATVSGKAYQFQLAGERMKNEAKKTFSSFSGTPIGGAQNVAYNYLGMGPMAAANAAIGVSDATIRNKTATKVETPGASITAPTNTQAISLTNPTNSSVSGVTANQTSDTTGQNPVNASLETGSEQESYIEKLISKIIKKEENVNPGISHASNWAQGIGTTANIANSVLSGVAQDLGPGSKNSNLQGQQAIGNALSSLGPYGALAGGLFNIASTIADSIGVNSSRMSGTAAAAAGVSKGQKLLNNLGSWVPGLGLLATKTAEGERSVEIDKIAGAFSGTSSDIDSSSELGGGRYLSEANKINNFVQEQNRRNQVLTNMALTNTLRKNNSYSQELQAQNANKYVGNNYQNTAVGKDGLKLPDRKMLDALYAKKITSFKEGGVIGVDSNVIPEGALHKELNHMEEHNEKLDKVITDKGIAVVTTDKKGNIEQVAEIEKEEIVFRLELTKKIEELWHEGTLEAMLKAGKILVKEIMGNTDDNTEEILDGNN